MTILFILGIVKLTEYQKEKKQKEDKYNWTHPKMSVTKVENRQAVDLGLSVKWATCDIGANHPTEKGNEYGWSEVKKKEIKTKENSNNTNNIDKKCHIIEKKMNLRIRQG